MEHHDAKTKISQKYGEIPLIHSLKNAKIGEYIILEKLSSGAFGQVYKAVKNCDGICEPLVIKLTQEHEMNDQEYKILQDVSAKSK